MPQFYFDINDGKTRTIDRDGQDLPSFETARDLAFQELAYIIRDEIPNGHILSFVVTVRNEANVPIYVAVSTLIGERLELA